jgi:bacterioferritin
MMKQSLDFLVQTAQDIDLRAEQEEIIKHYQEMRRILQAERVGEFTLKLRDIITQEQDHEIDLRNAVELR